VRLAALLLLIAGALLASPVAAQPDTTAAADTSVVLGADTVPLGFPDPGMVLRRSLLVPGWGQITNGDYVKAGIAVAGVSAAVTYAVVYGLRTVRYRRAAIYADCIVTPASVPEGTCDDAASFEDEYLESGSPPASVSRAFRDSSRRNRDFMILISGLAYALQAIDAFVSAHLAGFDVSEDLSLRLVPTPTGATAALRWTF
jgi:hypothetical protein